MSKAYIPAQTWVVCTFQQNPSPQKLIATRQATVFYKGDKEKAFLTTFDKNTKEQFVCKKPMNLWMGLGGLALGLVLASNPVGWIVAGVCAVVIIGAVAIIKTHDCSVPLNAGKWVNYKEGVKFDGYNAIIETSMISCDNGGVLQPIISGDVAYNAAKAIAFENIKETTVVTVGAIATGFFMGKSGGFIKAIQSVFTKSGALFTIGGMGAMYAMTTYQSNYMRNNEDYKNNDVYQRMNNIESKDWSELPTYEKESWETVKNTALSGAPPNLKDFANVIQLYKTGLLIIEDKNLKAQFEQLSQMNKVELRNSPEARELLMKIQSENPEIFDKIKKSPNSKPIRLRPTMRNNVIKEINNKISNNKWSTNNPNSLVSKASSIVLFFVPVISGYFSENARRKLAENSIQDITNSISVRTKD